MNLDLLYYFCGFMAMKKGALNKMRLFNNTRSLRTIIEKSLFSLPPYRGLPPYDRISKYNGG